jgi:hypothetical protein
MQRHHPRHARFARCAEAGSAQQDNHNDDEQVIHAGSLQAGKENVAMKTRGGKCGDEIL